MEVETEIDNWARLAERHMVFLNEMARICYLDGLEIHVRTNDPRNIPHFHIWDRESDGEKFHTCIEIKSSKYFHHTGKEDKLNASQRKKLVKKLKSKEKDSPFNSIWDEVLYEWNKNNSSMKVSLAQPMPDYSNIQDN